MELLFEFVFEFLGVAIGSAIDTVFESERVKVWIKTIIMCTLLFALLVFFGFVAYIGLRTGDWFTTVLGLGLFLLFAIIGIWKTISRHKEGWRNE